MYERTGREVREQMLEFVRLLRYRRASRKELFPRSGGGFSNVLCMC